MIKGVVLSFILVSTSVIMGGLLLEFLPFSKALGDSDISTTTSRVGLGNEFDDPLLGK